MLGRRGPAYARFTTKELRELGEIAGSDIIVDPADLELSEQEEAEVAADRTLRANLEVLREWSTREPQGRPRRLRIKFWLRPAEVLGSAAVTGFRAERTRLEDGKLVGTGSIVDFPAQMVLRSVGYRVVPPAGLPLDPDTGTVPHDGGRVLLDGDADARDVRRGLAQARAHRDHRHQQAGRDRDGRLAAGRRATACRGRRSGTRMRSSSCCGNARSGPSAGPAGRRSTPPSGSSARPGTAPGSRSPTGRRCCAPRWATSSADRRPGPRR